jgi:hypothetical protein
MSLRIVLIVAGIVGILFGAYFLAWPDQAIQSFEIGAPDLAGRLFGRALGVSLITVGIINLMSTADIGSPALRAVVVGNILIHLLNPIVDMIEPFPWTAGRWVGLAVHAIFIVAFGYYLLNWGRVTAAPRRA